MPVTVNEMEVNTTVVDSSGGKSSASGPEQKGEGGLSKKDKEAIIRECMQRVEELLENLKGR